jgi:ubiquinone/menaquinone biosynthesis C-methylase UbiE
MRAQPENITGVDLLADRVAKARQLCPEALKVCCGNAANLTFPDATFDLVLQSMVFTSILDPTARQQIAAEMLRVLKEDGLILWYDFYVNNPWNADVRGVKRHEIYRLFPDCRMEL